MPARVRPPMMDRPITIAAGLLDRALRRRLSTDLRGALGRGELALHYQPRLSLADGCRTGAEVLLRWTHAARGPVPPAAFIPIAEDSDLILGIGGWVLRRAAAEAARHPELGRISVNISARQLADDVLPAQVDRALAESGLAPDRLELELTESLPLAEGTQVAAMLGGLRGRGVSLALDDFGTGYASFARLRRLPFTTLKLDHSLLAPLPGQPADLAILRAIRDMGQAMQLRLVGEGVETPAQHALLTELGFDEAQGYFLGSPMPLEQLLALDAMGPAHGTGAGAMAPLHGSA